MDLDENDPLKMYVRELANVLPLTKKEKKTICSKKWENTVNWERLPKGG